MKEELTISKDAIQKLKDLADKGDIRSLSMFSKLMYIAEFDKARTDYLKSEEISEDTLLKIQSYIESGCKLSLNSGEEHYLEVLTLMNSMRRKYGRSHTLKFFQGSPFALSYAQSRRLYEASINLFYSDSSVERKALRNLKAQQLEDAADMVLAVAKDPKDFEIYERLISSSAKIRQLDQPDPDPIPPATFSKPIKYYTLDCERIGIKPPSRNEIAKQIDSISEATESEKRRALMDSGVEDVDFESLLDEYEEKG